jgi:hypothetical protein
MASWNTDCGPAVNGHCEGALVVIDQNQIEVEHADLLARRQSHERMQLQIDKLEEKTEFLVHSRNEGQHVMLVGALATSFQYALTQKFPGVFTTKFPHCCTFGGIDKTITAQNKHP